MPSVASKNEAEMPGGMRGEGSLLMSLRETLLTVARMHLDAMVRGQRPTADALLGSVVLATDHDRTLMNVLPFKLHCD